MVVSECAPRTDRQMIGSATDLRALERAGHNIMGRDSAGRTPCHLAALVLPPFEFPFGFYVKR